MDRSLRSLVFIAHGDPSTWDAQIEAHIAAGGVRPVAVIPHNDRPNDWPADEKAS